MSQVTYKIRPSVRNQILNELFSSAWPKHDESDFQPILFRSLTYICAYAGDRLIGFVNVAWDGGVHAFILDTTVHPDYQRQGIGTELLWRAAEESRKCGIEWLHVDYEPHLDGFYRNAGFRPTLAGLMRLRAPDTDSSG